MGENNDVKLPNHREAYNVLPSFLENIGLEVISKLQPKYPKIGAWFGPTAAEEVKQLHPGVEQPYYLDWICFGIEGHRIENAHIGVLFEINQSPITYRIGVHVVEDIWKEKQSKLIKESRKNKNSDYEYQKSFEEYQLNDSARELNINDLDSELAWITSRVAYLYEKFNPILKVD